MVSNYQVKLPCKAHQSLLLNKLKYKIQNIYLSFKALADTPPLEGHLRKVEPQFSVLVLSKKKKKLAAVIFFLRKL